jgi:predicted peptidase
MPQTTHRFEQRLACDVSIPYLLHLPEGYERRSDWPLVLFLHGSAERGQDAEVVRRQALPQALDHGMALPAVVVSPQCPPGEVWAQQHHALLALLDTLSSSLRVDPKRTVYTGLSLGGAGVVHFAAAYPDRVTAVAPMCGPWTFYYLTPALAKKPLWVFHGDADEVVSVRDSLRFVEAAKAYGGKPRLTIYPGVGHDAWTNAFADPEFQSWLITPEHP